MTTKLEAGFTENDVFALNTFIDCLTGLDFLQLASITIVAILLPDFFIVELLFMLCFFLPNFSNNLWRFFIPTKRTFHNSIILHLMLCPLSEAIKMEIIKANCCTCCNCITFNNLHMTYGTQIIFIILVFLFDNQILSSYIQLDIFEKIRYFIIMYSATSNDISKFFICVCILIEKGMLDRQIENFNKCMQSMHTLLRDIGIA